ncbi:DgyrCDS6981 [Dimorphilus gyrociliatus]|uniref:tRNA-specific adenosine deaminase 1 n=1 Tax=Dimorphilus gyrociliatus TaxID=2664684 RepID=A0A7I8VRX1_9ANNE|nr:DgyrCDS6981 [Dimorphilus gyrociliatus]
MTTPSDFEKIASACIQHYESALKKKGKPHEKEWTLLSAIILWHNEENFTIASMATGTKCLGEVELNDKGNLIHDSHAEVLSRRAFLRYLYDEIERINDGGISKYIDFKSGKFRLKDNTKVIMFCSRTPCGDASIIPKQEEEPEAKRPKLDIHRTGAKCVPGEPMDERASGMGYHVTCSLRTKPGRGHPTRSLSCSDKIAKWCLIGLQGAIMMHFFDLPLYIHAIVLGNCPFNQECAERALFKRFDGKIPNLGKVYNKIEPIIYKTNTQFNHQQMNNRTVACGAAIIWWKSCKDQQVCVNGLKQGVSKKAKDSPKSRCSVCKLELFSTAQRLISKLKLKIESNEILKTYESYKQASVEYQRVWTLLREDALKNWPRTDRKLNSFS